MKTRTHSVTIERHVPICDVCEQDTPIMIEASYTYKEEQKSYTDTYTFCGWRCFHEFFGATYPAPFAHRTGISLVVRLYYGAATGLEDAMAKIPGGE